MNILDFGNSGMSWEQGNYEGQQQGGYGGYNDYGQQQGDYGGQQQGGYGGHQQPGYGAPPSHQGQFFQPEPVPQQQQQGVWGAGGTQQGGWGGPGGGQAAPGVNFGGAQLPIDPLVTNMAMNYGANVYEQNKDEIKKKMEGYVDKYISVGQLKVILKHAKIFISNNHLSVLLCCGQLLRHKKAEAASLPISPL